MMDQGGCGMFAFLKYLCILGEQTARPHGKHMNNPLSGHQTMKRHSFASLLVLLIFFLASGFADSGQDRGKKILRLGLHVSGMGRMDPHFAAASQDRAMADMVFNGLLRFSPGNSPNIELDLAREMPEFKIVNNRQIWKILLRKGVMFHPGPYTNSYEMTADDVVFSLNKSRAKKRCAYAAEYSDMIVEKVARYEIRVILDKPLSTVLFFPKLANYNGGFIISKKAVEAMGYEAFERHPVGTGPFAFSKYEKGGPLHLTAHDRYFRGRPRLDGVQIHFIPDVNRRQTAFDRNELDVYIGSGEKKWLAGIGNTENKVVDIHGVGEVLTLHFNLQAEPLKDIRVRQAIAYALCRNAFLNTSDPELVGPVFSPVPGPFLPGGLSKNDVIRFGLDYEQDIEKARQMLKEAGYPNGFTLDLVSSEKRYYKASYDILKQELARINIKCNVSVVNHREMHARIRKSPRPLVIYAAWRPSTDIYLTGFFHSDSIVGTGKKPDTNFSGSNQIDQLIESARTQIDPKTQIQMWEQAQIKILNDLAAYPLIYSKQIFIRRPAVDYGHPLLSTMALYPQFTEKTDILSDNKQ